jgi:hypothetical protein
MRNGGMVSTLIVIGVALACPAEAYLLDDSKEFPMGITEAEIRAHFPNSSPTQISMRPGMSGIMYQSLPGNPTFYFCGKILWSSWTTINNADLIKFRHLIEENENLLGVSTMALTGQTDSGQEWTGIDADWKLPDGRIATLALQQYSGNVMSIVQRITNSDGCPE